MIMTVDELKKFIDTSIDNDVLELKLSAAEAMIRAYTHNGFHNRTIRCFTSVSDGVVSSAPSALADGDTVEITESDENKGLFIYRNGRLTPTPNDCERCLITKVEYPPDVKAGIVNLLDWDLNNRDRIGVSSETVSRHSVTYFNLDGTNSVAGYPSFLMGFLKPYMKARF